LYYIQTPYLCLRLLEVLKRALAILQFSNHSHIFNGIIAIPINSQCSLGGDRRVLFIFVLNNLKINIMALIKWGAIVVDGRGKIGGQVLSRGRSGAIIRTKVTPVNPRTSRQTAVRAILGALSSAWRALTQPQRESWNAAVFNFQKTNIFGDTVNPTGKNLYVGLNTNLTKVSEPNIDVPPVPAELVAPIISDFTADGTVGLLDFAVANASVDQKLYIQASPQVSAGITNISSKVSLIKVEPQSSGSVLFSTDYTSVYGPLIVGQKIFLRVSAVNKVTGQMTVPEILSTIVT